jgi:hypothetical protein
MNENDWIFDKRLWTFILMATAAVLVEMWLDNQSFTAAFCGLLIGGAFSLALLAWRLLW